MPQDLKHVTQKYMSSWGSTSIRLLHEFMSSAVARSSTRPMKSGGARACPGTGTLYASLIHCSKILTASTSTAFVTPLTASPVPKVSDRTQLEAKQVRLSDMPSITLDDTDTQTVSLPPQPILVWDTLHLHDIARNACKLHNLLYMLTWSPMCC